MEVGSDYELTLDGKEKKWWVNNASGSMTLGLRSGVTQPKVRATNDFWFFWVSRQGDVAFSGKIYSAALWDYDTEIGVDVDTDNDDYVQLLDLLPAEVGGVAGLWDNVEKKSYPSAGTSDFVAGPEAEEEVPQSDPDGISPLIKFGFRTGMIIFFR